MLRTTEMKAAVRNRISPRFVLLAVLPVLLLLAAMAPASAMAGAGGGGGGSQGDCEATLTATQSTSTASFSVDCGDGNDIRSVNLRTNEQNEGSVEGDNNTECTEQSSREFDCAPPDPDSSIGGRFESDGDDNVCSDPRLTVDFTVDLEDASTEDIDNVVVSDCSDSSGSGSGDEDDGSTPEGGVDSGAGGTAKPSAASGAALPLTGAALIVLALASAGLLLRKMRTTP
jgi:opacity protein-like surface antigen